MSPLDLAMAKNSTKVKTKVIPSHDGETPDFNVEYFPDYNEWKMLPIQLKYATLAEYNNDAIYDMEDWLELHIMCAHQQRYIR